MITDNTDIGSGEVMGSLAEMAAEWGEARRVAGAAVGEIAAGWLAPRYLLTLRTQLAAHDAGPERFALLGQAAGVVMAFRRGDFWAARVELEREWLELERQKHRDNMEAGIAKLAEANRKKRDLNEPMTEEELKACVDKVDEIMGLR